MAFVVLAWASAQPHWFSVEAPDADTAWLKVGRHLGQMLDGGVVLGDNDVFTVNPDPYHGDWLRRADSLQANQWRRNAAEHNSELVAIP